MKTAVKQRWIPGILVLLLGLLLPGQALAAGGSLTLTGCQEGAVFQVYRVAEGDKLVGDFADYSVDLSSASRRDAAATLAGYVARDALPATKTATVSQGKAVFSGLEAGLYLVVGETTVQGKSTYVPVPCLIQVSAAGSVTAVVKHDVTHDSGHDKDKITCQVKKVWSGDQESTRPEEITVQLLRNGAVYQRATLSSANNWSYTWNNLSASSRWQVVEETVPAGYRVSVSQEGTTFTITNTYETTPSTPTQPTTPANPDTPTEPTGPNQPTTPTEPTNPNQPTTPTTPTNPSTPTTTTSKPTLPQTGQLNWPVPVLAAAGLSLCAAGWLIQRRKGNRRAG